MLTPRSIPGEFVSPRILRHAPSCYILVTMRAQMKWEVKREKDNCRINPGIVEGGTARKQRLREMSEAWREVV